MIYQKYLTHFLVLCLSLLTACTPQTPKPIHATSTPKPAYTATPLPLPSPPGTSIVWNELQVRMEQLEVTNEFLTDFGSTRLPSPGTKFLWVHIRLKNEGTLEIQTPIQEHYSILYAANEFKPVYGHRAGYTDYTSLDASIFPAQELDGWLRFDIPAAAELRDLRFVFLPESSQVGTTYSSPNYPYSNEKPTYVWTCIE